MPEVTLLISSISEKRASYEEFMQNWKDGEEITQEYNSYTVSPDGKRWRDYSSHLFHGMGLV